MADAEHQSGPGDSPITVVVGSEAARRLMKRRALLQTAAVGSVVAVIGGVMYRLLGPEDPATRRAREEVRADGRARLPPGQHLVRNLVPMGGLPGDPSPSAFRVKIHGLVEKPFALTYQELLAEPQVEQTCDVHCVTTWSALDTHWTGVRVSHLAERAKVRPEARFVIFEAAHGYTSNISLEEALKPNVLVAHHLEGDPLEGTHGSPVRSLVPDRYFWKSAKWLTGIRFAEADEPGFWETRGYHNHADPWNEERTS